MNFEYLADHKDKIPTIAKWYFDQWGDLEADNSLGKTILKLHNYLNRDKIPLLILAFDNHDTLGVAQLKYHEMKIFPEREHWIGGIFVPKQHRGKKIGQKLVEEIENLAKSLGVNTLYLQTRKLNGGMYKDLGWIPLEKVEYRGIEVLVMEKRV